MNGWVLVIVECLSEWLCVSDCGVPECVHVC